MGANKDAPLPAKLFEVGDVVLLDDSEDVGARNSRRLLVLYSNAKAGFEVVHGVLDRVLLIAGASRSVDQPGYSVKESDEATYFPRETGEGGGRWEKEVGIFGIVHPDVLSKFDIVNPCSVLELDLEPLLGGVDGRLEL